MNILLTGGTGFIGRSLCAALVAAGHGMTVLSRAPEAVAGKCGPGVQAIGSLAGWRPGSRVDAVINLAGEPIIDRPWSESRRQQLRNSRVALTRELVEAMARWPHVPGVVLSGSAIGLYGDSGDTVLDETAPPASDFAAQLCADWEAAALGAESLGARVCVLRTGLVLDRHGGLLGRMLLPFRLGLAAQLGDGRQWMSWISMADYVAAVLMLLENPEASGPFNMTAPQPVTNAQFTRALASSLHRPALLRVPSFVLRGLLGQRAPMLLGGQRVLPLRLQALGFVFRHSELTVALPALLERPAR